VYVGRRGARVRQAWTTWSIVEYNWLYYLDPVSGNRSVMKLYESEVVFQHRQSPIRLPRDLRYQIGKSEQSNEYDVNRCKCPLSKEWSVT